LQKLKNLWSKNKVLIVLGVILIICLIAIIGVTFSYFIGGGKSVYGDRLDGISEHTISDEVKNNYVDNLKTNETVMDVRFVVKGKIIYVNIDFKGDTPLVEAEGVAASSLANLNEDILGYYDIEFVIKSDDTENSEGFTILGARNVTGSGLVWNNNTPVESEE